MVSQALHLLAKSVAVKLLRCFDDARVKRAPAILQQSSVRNLVCQGVLKGVFDIRKETRRVKKLRGLKLNQSTSDFFLGLLRDGLEQRKWHVLADHRRGLEQALVRKGQPIDARCQDGLDGHRHRSAWRLFFQTIISSFPDQSSRFNQILHALFEEERISLGSPNQ